MENFKIYEELSKIISKEQLTKDEIMKRHTTFCIGGKADFFIEARTEKDITNTYRFAKENNIPCYVIGKGSNLLVKDNGIRGIVIQNKYKNIEILEETDDEMILQVASGTTLLSLANFALKNGLEGLEFSYGIPGSFGGAVRMNAGAYGGEMKNCVRESLCLNSNGDLITLTIDEHGFRYRNSTIAENGMIVLHSKIALKKGDKVKIKEEMDKNMKARLDKQPYNMHSAGSTFKRGDGFITAAVIDEAGLKGYRNGNVLVSFKHAGFVVNAGGGTAKEVLDLIKYIKEKVKTDLGKDLEEEIVIIGE